MTHLSMKSVLNNSIRATSCSRSAGQQQHAMAVLQQRDDVHTLIQQLINAANFDLAEELIQSTSSNSLQS